MKQKIVPSIWLQSEKGEMQAVIDYYSNVFGEAFGAGNISNLGNTPSGNTEICQVEIFGQSYSLMTTEKEHHSLNDAISFMVNCQNQEEIDHFWDYFTAEGQESQCGWCIDKYGLRWQVLPQNLSELMALPNAFEVMMKQKKIIINEYK